MLIRLRIFIAVMATGLLVVVCRPNLTALRRVERNHRADSSAEGRSSMGQTDSGRPAIALNTYMFAARTSAQDQLLGLRGTRGLVLEGELDQRTCLLGEPLIVSRSVVNITNAPVTIAYDYVLRTTHDVFEIRDSDDQKLHRLREAIYCFGGPVVWTIEPGQRLVGTHNLAKLYVINEPGEYRIMTRLRSDGGYAKRDAKTGTVVLEPAWHGDLEYTYGTVRVVMPRRKDDLAALGVLTRYPKEPEVDDPSFDFTYPYMFDDEQKLRNVVEQFPNSRYAAYARYFLAVRRLNEFERVPRSRYGKEMAKEAAGLLAGVDRSQFGRLFQQQVLFHLFYAHQATGSAPPVVEPIAEEFRRQFPDSQYLYWVEHPEELKAHRKAG